MDQSSHLVLPRHQKRRRHGDKLGLRDEQPQPALEKWLDAEFTESWRRHYRRSVRRQRREPYWEREGGHHDQYRPKITCGPESELVTAFVVRKSDCLRYDQPP